MAKGSDEKIAKVMCMHKNYDYILTSSEESLGYFKEAFNANDGTNVNYALPRVDLLLDNKF